MLLGSKYTENKNNLYYMTIDTYSIAKSNDIKTDNQVTFLHDSTLRRKLFNNELQFANRT